MNLTLARIGVGILISPVLLPFLAAAVVFVFIAWISVYLFPPLRRAFDFVLGDDPFEEEWTVTWENVQGGE